MNYENYIKECEKIEKTNKHYLDLFTKDLEQTGLKPKTISRHYSNVDFYINTYLLKEGALSMENGISMLDDFLGNFFIRKCMWSTPANIKSTAASIKKFYKSMLDHQIIEKDDYDELCFCIKDNMEFWQELCADYNDPNNINPFMFF